MPAITYDARSFMIDGRRIWIVGGSIHYARVPRELWADRISQAKQAGLNTIETPIQWSLHEPRPGVFEFDGDKDIRHFVELIRDAGMHCILRPGPYIGSGWDFGGLPSWLRKIPDIRFRADSQPFLEACSRYLSAVAKQLKGLQVTDTGKGGPILLVQNESHWTCGMNPVATKYLGELHRYLREAGFSVPTISANNLWQQVEGEIEAWAGGTHMLETMRQLATVVPDQPRLVVDFSVTTPSVFAVPVQPGPSPAAVQRQLVEILAGGGQFSIDPFHGGTNLGFTGGRRSGEPAAFLTNTNDRGAPLTEAGGRGATYSMVRRVATFASHFGRVLANLDPTYQPVVTHPASLGERGGASVSMIHAKGSQGQIIFALAPEHDGRPTVKHTDLLLPDGSSLRLAFGSQCAAWCLMDMHLDRLAHLDYCTLNALGLIGSVFVCFGPPGAAGIISINQSPIEVEVPRGKLPVIIEHEGITLVICSESQTDQIAMREDGVYLAVAGFDRDGVPITTGSGRTVARILPDGSTDRAGCVIEPMLATKAPPLSGWETAPMDEHVNGTSPRFAAIEGPADLTDLGSPYGYGWYRTTLKGTATTKIKLMAPSSADRLHLFLDDEAIGVLGVGPGASRELSVTLKKGERSLVILADNMGRYTDGTDLGEAKGLYGPLLEQVAFKVPKARIEASDPIEPLAFRAPLWNLREGDTTLPIRASWSFVHRKKSPIVLMIEPMPQRCVLVLNNEPLRFIDRHSCQPIVLDHKTLNRGNNTVSLMPISSLHDKDDIDALMKSIAASVHFFEGMSNPAAKSDWAFAKWEPPAMTSFTHISKSAMGGAKGPTWWQCSFSLDETDTPMFLDVNGLTKGQLYLNGHHIGRYWTATPDGKSVPPQSRHYLPACWLSATTPNELMIFDEHGGNPARCKLVCDPAGASVLA